MVPVDAVRSFLESHPHPNVLEPLSRAERKRFVAVYEDDEVVATAALQRRAGRIDQLSAVLVHPKMRGQGLGGPLMDAIRAEARHAGARWIVCGVYRRDPDVSPYYRAQGFRTIVPFIAGTAARFPLGLLSRALAWATRVEAGPDSIRIMARRP